MSKPAERDPSNDRARATDAEKRACLKRELGMRRRVYPRRVADGRMTEADAETQIRILEAILADYPEPQRSLL